MNIPEPRPGLVIRYSYLWKDEADAGREEGTKDRPCAVVVAVMSHAGEREVLVLPITHSAPANVADAVEIPAETKARLRLDFDRSWIVISEANEFVWPGPDIRPIPGLAEFDVAYGFLPPRFFSQVRDKVVERDRRKRMLRVRRAE